MPGPVPVASPNELGPFEIVATVVSDDAQNAAVVRSWVVLSL